MILFFVFFRSAKVFRLSHMVTATGTTTETWAIAVKFWG
jgi:hypothetical protein